MFWDRPPLPEGHPLVPYAHHIMDVLDYVIVLLWVVIVMKAAMVAVLVYASHSFVKWRRAAEAGRTAMEKSAVESAAAAAASQECTKTVRCMVVTIQEFLSMARGWAASAQAHEMQATNQSTLSKLQISKATEEVKGEVRQVPESTAVRMADMLAKADSGVLRAEDAKPPAPEAPPG